MRYTLNIATKVPGSENRPFGLRYTHFAKVTLGVSHNDNAARWDAGIIVEALRAFKGVGGHHNEPDYWAFMLDAWEPETGQCLDRFEIAAKPTAPVLEHVK